MIVDSIVEMDENDDDDYGNNKRIYFLETRLCEKKPNWYDN